MLVVARALQLRRDRPELFSGYEAVRCTGPPPTTPSGSTAAAHSPLATRLPAGWSVTAGGGTPPSSFRWGKTGRAERAELQPGRVRCPTCLADSRWHCWWRCWCAAKKGNEEAMTSRVGTEPFAVSAATTR